MKNYRLVEVWGERGNRKRSFLYRGPSKSDMQEAVARSKTSERRPFSELRYYIGAKRFGAHQL